MLERRLREKERNMSGVSQAVTNKADRKETGKQELKNEEKIKKP